MLTISNYSCARSSVFSLVINNLVYLSYTGASVRPAAHVVTCILSATAAAFLEIDPLEPNVDNY